MTSAGQFTLEAVARGLRQRHMVYRWNFTETNRVHRGHAQVSKSGSSPIILTQSSVGFSAIQILLYIQYSKLFRAGFSRNPLGFHYNPDHFL